MKRRFSRVAILLHRNQTKRKASSMSSQPIARRTFSTVATRVVIWTIDRKIEQHLRARLPRRHLNRKQRSSAIATLRLAKKGNRFGEEWQQSSRKQWLTVFHPLSGKRSQRNGSNRGQEEIVHQSRSRNASARLAWSTGGEEPPLAAIAAKERKRERRY